MVYTFSVLNAVTLKLLLAEEPMLFMPISEQCFYKGFICNLLVMY